MQNRRTCVNFTEAMHPLYPTGLVWFRRDLRLNDNPALQAALRRCQRVHCVFVLDRTILDTLPRRDRRVAFILQCLKDLDASLREAAGGVRSAGLLVLQGDPQAVIPSLARTLGVGAVFSAEDYEPYARARDRQVQDALHRDGIAWQSVQDHVLVAPAALLNQTQQPYRVFTPYLRAWRKRLNEASLVPRELPLEDRLAESPPAWEHPVPALSGIGFEAADLESPKIHGSASTAQALLNDFASRMALYHTTRDFPAVKGPSYLSVHLRFGSLSIRQAASLALARAESGDQGAEVWLSELAWRDFYFQILAHYPHVARSAFKPAYDRIEWESGERAQFRFDAWCLGQTGFPLVDAAMHQLNQTGYMHNRLRMVAGSFLVKHLGIDWRWGERYFAQKLNDFDLAANNGGWQWVSSSGCDAQPYFRIFNPLSQSQKFDPNGQFIKRYLPQLGELGPKQIHAPWLAPASALDAHGVQLGRDYPHPIIDLQQARNRTLLRYAVVGNTDA